MKKIVLGVVIAFGATTMVSCKKDYNCKCEKTWAGNNGSITKDDGVYSYKATRVKAEKMCNDNEGSGSDILGTWTRNCEIE